MVLSSQAFAFHRVRGLVFENPQPQPQAESYVKLFFEADGMHGVGGNPAGAPNAGEFAHELLDYRLGHSMRSNAHREPLDRASLASPVTSGPSRRSAKARRTRRRRR